MNKRFSGTQNRSAFIVGVLTRELDRMDTSDIEQKLRDKVMKEKVIPEVRKMLKEYETDQISMMFSGSPKMRNELRLKLSVTVSDDELMKVMHEVMKEYE